MVKALGKAIAARGDVDREALRAVTEGMTVEAWCRAHEEAFMELLGGPGAGLEEAALDAEPAIEIRDDEVQEPTVSVETSGTRGIYCVAFGDPARACAARLMETVREHLPEIPIAFCGAEPLGLEDVFIAQPDSDVGGRRAKLKAYELSPWDVTLYLDVDTEVISGDARFWFELIEDGWEFVIAKDPHLHDTLQARVRAGSEPTRTEYELTSQVMTATH